MRKIQLLLLCCLNAMTVSGQFYYSTAFFYYDTLACPFDNAKTVIYPKGWMIYQTTDGTWGGAADSSRCISVQPFGSFNQPRLDLAQIDLAKPLFIKAKPSEFAGLDNLEPNYLYNAYMSFHVSDTTTLPVTGTNCVQDLCSGLFMGISVPGPMRIHTGLLSNANFPPTYLYRDLYACFPTEYLNSQQMRELVMKFTFKPGIAVGSHFLYLDYASVMYSFPQPGLISAVNADIDNYDSFTNEYNVNVMEAADNGGSFFENFILQYTAPTFPSAQDPSYVIGTIVPNKPEPQVINLVVDEFQTLEIQPFTYLVGALAQGSDTLRHQVNLVNNGGDICLNFLDLIMDGGEEYRHGSGSLSMNNPFSCIQFRNGSALRVLEGATLYYGNDGAGMLALCTGGTIALERDAMLVIDCVVNLSECNDALPPQQIYMDLPRGAKLVFTENARLTNRFSKGQEMLLNVRMLGGTIEDEALAPEDRALIRRIYLEPAPDFADNVTITPNPFVETPTMTYLAGKTENVTLRWSNLNGQIVREETLQTIRGLNKWQPKTPEAVGIYFLTVQSEAGKLTKKLVKISR